MSSRPHVLALLLAVAVPPGCGSPEAPAPAVPVPPPVAESAARPAADAAVHVLRDGVWSVFGGCRDACVDHHSFWVDLTVQGDETDKQVGVVWTGDGWKTFQTTWATYEQPGAEAGTEQWGADAALAPTPEGAGAPAVEYAAFVTQAGHTRWDPGTHRVVQ